ncbi:hypothetical protein QFC21_006099 [Naganishia friedmannii]|uniref:Uncharacterized protein n=1 Tax=Naganishia friedmannii TaxID=89922 RepID=A0ACC2V5A0_9TREE|nr:hypothetical protein QFC21_006099 [Naganishia friedmannii]
MLSKIASATVGAFALSWLFASAAPTKSAKARRLRRQVALTFDDGPYQFEGDITSHLGDSKATFFLNGNNWGCIYDRADELRGLYAAGHTLGSHGWSHPHFNDLSWDQIHDELWKVEEAFIRILGVRPLYFRPPYGEYNDLLFSALSVRGYKKAFLWSDDTHDGDLAPVDQSKGVYDEVALSYPAPHMVLGHSVYDSTANNVVPYGVSQLKNSGYQLVAVDTCMGDQGEWPYEWVGEPQSGNWQC